MSRLFVESCPAPSVLAFSSDNSPMMPSPASMASPASTSSSLGTDPILPTPVMDDFPQTEGSAPRASIISPTIISPSASGSPRLHSSRFGHDLFSPQSPGMLPPSMSRPDIRSSYSRGKQRAAPPPPINLHKDGADSRHSESSLLAGLQQQPTKGLNIPGIPTTPTATITRANEPEDVEKLDALRDLIPSPRRTAFQQQMRDSRWVGIAPSSPAWQSMEIVSPQGRGSSEIPSFSSIPPSPLRSQHYARRDNLPHAHHHAHSHSQLDAHAAVQSYDQGHQGFTHSRGPSVSRSPLTGLPQNHFSPTPTHGIHARNLSLFFPQPGAAPPLDPSLQENATQQIPGIPTDRAEKTAFAGYGGTWKFGQSGTKEEYGPTPARSKRRGHHHKHSLSHNFFSFLDPTITNPALAASPLPSPAPPLTPSRPTDTPIPVPMPLLSSSLTLSSERYSLSWSAPSAQLYTSFAAVEFLIGAALWVEGQMGGWKCLTGVGYLVVFDALGVGVSFVGRRGTLGGSRSIRRPYGVPRILALLSFVQSLFLLFAAVYIAKELVESMVLGPEGHENSSHGRSHGEASSGDQRPLPLFLLLCAVGASLSSALCMANHANLVEAVGCLFLPTRLTQSRLAEAVPALWANPFTLTVAGSALCAALAEVLRESWSLQTFDSLFAISLTILTTALSLPPTMTFALCLLQTTPPASMTRMAELSRALKVMRSDRRIQQIGTMRCWSISPCGPAPLDMSLVDQSPSSSPAHSPQPSSSFSPQSSRRPYQTSLEQLPNLSGLSQRGQFAPRSQTDSSCVVTLTVELLPDCSEADVLEITKGVWSALDKAAGREGEVTVYVKRGIRS